MIYIWNKIKKWKKSPLVNLFLRIKVVCLHSYMQCKLDDWQITGKQNTAVLKYTLNSIIYLLSHLSYLSYSQNFLYNISYTLFLNISCAIFVVGSYAAISNNLLNRQKIPICAKIIPNRTFWIFLPSHQKKKVTYKLMNEKNICQLLTKNNVSNIYYIYYTIWSRIVKKLFQGIL